ncbi:MAG: pyridoxamine 5'-phosphate oxidase family protein [Carbonactinosporaceae bacterium]
MSTPLSSTPRTRLGRLPERARTDRRDLYDVLDDGLVAHLGIAVDGHPVVVPTIYGRAGETLYLHGSTGSRSLRTAMSGARVCVTVTHTDGLVLARSIFHHSVNYRSAVIYGTARPVVDSTEKLDGLRTVSEHVAPGRWQAARPPSRRELAATLLLALPLDEASVKVRSGPPGDDDADLNRDVWAGVIPSRQVWDEPVPDPALAPGTAVPEHVRRIAAGGHPPARPG